MIHQQTVYFLDQQPTNYLRLGGLILATLTGRCIRVF